jgi:hypothetical protein
VDVVTKVDVEPGAVVVVVLKLPGSVVVVTTVMVEPAALTVVIVVGEQNVHVKVGPAMVEVLIVGIMRVLVIERVALVVRTAVVVVT